MQVDVKHGITLRTFKGKRNGRREETTLFVDADKFNNIIKEAIDAIIKAKPDFPASTEGVEGSIFNDYIMIRVPRTDTKTLAQISFVDILDIDKEVCRLKNIKSFPDDLTSAQILELQKLIMTNIWKNWKTLQ